MPSSADPRHVPTSPRPRARLSRPIETVLLASTACLLAAVAWPIAMGGFAGAPETVAEAASPDSAVDPGLPALAAPAADGPVIQLALILDTSSSMDGLIDQARTQLWSVVNALDGASRGGVRPRLEIAVYEYGNDALSGESGWIRRVRPFTSELDSVSEGLFSLTTNGGSEHAGQAIGRSIDELDWSEGEGVLRVVYIAGNEDFAQGPVAVGEALERAKAKGIVVNTVYCGSADESDAPGWRAAAAANGGKFASIDPNHVQQYIAAPQDAKIAELGQAINETYVRYGADGRRGLDNLVAQDNNMAAYGEGSTITRSVAKSKAMYRNDSWDLVDAIEGNKLGYGEVDRSSLPEAIQHFDDEQLRAHVEGQRIRREALQSELATLAQDREAYVAAERERLAADDSESLDRAIIDAIIEQAEAAGFSIESA